MGLSQQISIGPYIEVLGTKEITQTNNKLGCPNLHENKTSAKFCSECGAEIISIEYEEKEILTAGDLLELSDLNEDYDLYSPEYLPSIFISNISSPYDIGFNIDQENVIDFTQTDKSISIKWMEETYKKEIDFFIENFGIDAVKVKWGIVSYWS
jgi:hypothetical protein